MKKAFFVHTLVFSLAGSFAGAQTPEVPQPLNNLICTRAGIIEVGPLALSDKGSAVGKQVTFDFSVPDPYYTQLQSESSIKIQIHHDITIIRDQNQFKNGEATVISRSQEIVEPDAKPKVQFFEGLNRVADKAQIYKNDTANFYCSLVSDSYLKAQQETERKLDIAREREALAFTLVEGGFRECGFNNPANFEVSEMAWKMYLASYADSRTRAQALACDSVFGLVHGLAKEDKLSIKQEIDSYGGPMAFQTEQNLAQEARRLQASLQERAKASGHYLKAAASENTQQSGAL